MVIFFYRKSVLRRDAPQGAWDCPKRAKPFWDKRLAVCRAHNLFAESEQIPHLQTEKCFLRRTRRRKKRIAIYLPPAGGKLCEAFWQAKSQLYIYIPQDTRFCKRKKCSIWCRRVDLWPNCEQPILKNVQRKFISFVKYPEKEKAGKQGLDNF